MPTSVVVILTISVAAAASVLLGVLARNRRRTPGGSRIVWIAAGIAIGGIPVTGLLIERMYGSADPGRQLAWAHATLDNDCAACHVTAETVSSEKCAACHSKLPGTSEIYSFDAHYAHYAPDRPTAVTLGAEGEVACAACHVEHRGRRADLRATATDGRCAACHATGSFDDAHAEFGVLAERLTDDAGLTFGHVRHVEYVLQADNLEVSEQACLACHVPAGDMRGFRPIAFDTACATCHLTGDIESAELPEQPPGVPLLGDAGGGARLTLGVERIETVRERLGPGEQWAGRASAAAFEVDAGFVVKTRVEHADPWILHNLRRLRRASYPSAGLADLLTVSTDLPPSERWRLYDEALAALNVQMDDLRGRDESWIHATLLEFDRTMQVLDRRIADSESLLDDQPFQLGAADPRLTETQLDAIDTFAAVVAEPCLQCHVVKQATIGRVQKAQTVLGRARFDHRPHALLRGCLDCHQRIPVNESTTSNGPLSPAIDDAGIHNIPGIATCRECHTTGGAPNRCRTCHVFHPDGPVASRFRR